MNADSFITFYTYILRENVIRFQRELLADFKLAPGIKKHTMYFLSYSHKYEGHSCIPKFYEANCNTRFVACADIVSYLCKFKTNWHQILDATFVTFSYLLAGKSLYNLVLISSKQSRL